MATRLFPKELNRWRYLLYLIGWAIVTGLSVWLLTWMHREIQAILLVIALAGIFKLVALDIPRTRHIGRSPWILGVFYGASLLLPPVAPIMQMLLLILPPDHQEPY